MENGDVFNSSTAPLTWHDFLERMRHPSASDFVKSIKSFIVSFLNNAPDPERDSAAVQNFLSNMEAAFRAHSLWAGCSEEELDSAGEGLEKYVMTKLFTRVYASLPEEVNEDNQLHQKVALIQQFIRPENLDIQPIYQNETSWLANPPQLHSNLLYIQRYRSQSRLVSEAAYFFTNMLSAESFIMNIDVNSLLREDTEFEKNMEFAQALLFGPSDSDNMTSQSDQSVGRHQETKHLDTTTQTQVPPQTSETKSKNERSHPKLAQKELQKINMYKAPRDKLVCILNCCKVINNLLLNASISSNENPPGADEFLPVLIYVTIKANPPQLHSNLLYIQRYRSQSRLVSEAAYFFTNMLSAESFIMNIDAKSLSMEDTEFEKNMEFAQALLFGPSDSDDRTSQSDQSVGRHQETKHLDTTTQTQVPPRTSETKSKNERSHPKDPYALDKVPSISDLENQGANMLMKDENAKQVFMDFPYLYAKSGDLTISDVEELLNNYKQLVFKYVCLSKGMGVSVTPLSALQTQSEGHTKTAKEPEDSITVDPNEEENENFSTEVVSKFGEDKPGFKSSQDETVASQDEIGE